MEDRLNAKSCKKRLSCKTCKERYLTPLPGYISKSKKVTSDGNQSQNDQDEVKSNFTGNAKYASTLGK